MHWQRVTRVKKTSKLTPGGWQKRWKKGFDRSVDRSVELHFGFCFQQNAQGGWVSG